MQQEAWFGNLLHDFPGSCCNASHSFGIVYATEKPGSVAWEPGSHNCGRLLGLIPIPRQSEQLRHFQQRVRVQIHSPSLQIGRNPRSPIRRAVLIKFPMAHNGSCQATKGLGTKRALHRVNDLRVEKHLLVPRFLCLKVRHALKISQLPVDRPCLLLRINRSACCPIRQIQEADESFCELEAFVGVWPRWRFR